jgi:aminoglycoside 3-N-acetyltransferase
LVAAVSPGGAAFVPTFNYGELPFEVNETRSLTGAITEEFRKLPGAKRSLHPTHPVAGTGSEVVEILAGHERTTPFGQASPLWRLWKRGAWVLLIGVDHTVNSTVHVAEEVLQLPYIFRTRMARVVTPSGTIEMTVRRPGCSDGFNKIDPALREGGKIVDGQIGAAKVMLMRSADVVQAAMSMLRKDRSALLCNRENCETCAEARRMLA